MKIRILGCGTSTGVPKIGNEWGKCDPNEPRNRRMRSSIMVEQNRTRVLVDCGPDLREQLLTAHIGSFDALIVTHDHSDHVHGIDDLRPVAAKLGHPIPIHARRFTLDALERRFAFAFHRAEFYRPIAETVELGKQARFGEIAVRTVDQPHGKITSLGLRFEADGKSFGYAIDYNQFTDEMFALYEGVDVLVSDCLTRQPHPTHAHLDGVLEWARQCRVGHLYLTHMGNGLDYATLVSELPDWASPAHDGLEIAL